MHKAQRLINHVALVLDGSSSMSRHSSKLIQVADEQIKHLALRSEEMSQETRVSVYLFADRVECLIFDMDVMRLPSISDLYRASGMTALVDSVIKSQDDLATTSQIYGDHAFLTFVLTDGQENASSNRWTSLSRYINGAENWTLGFLVPDSTGVAYMERIGASRDSIDVWDVGSASGIVQAASRIRTATDTFMTNRASGIRGSRGVFSTGTDAINKRTVTGTLTPLTNFSKFPVVQNCRIDDFVSAKAGRYTAGIAYYQLMKSEKIQPRKEILVVDKKKGTVYGGPEARGLVGLPNDREVRVRPDANPLYDIFVQSTSFNRNLLSGTSVLIRN